MWMSFSRTPHQEYRRRRGSRAGHARCPGAPASGAPALGTPAAAFPFSTCALCPGRCPPPRPQLCPAYLPATLLSDRRHNFRTSVNKRDSRSAQQLFSFFFFCKRLRISASHSGISDLRLS